MSNMFINLKKNEINKTKFKIYNKKFKYFFRYFLKFKYVLNINVYIYIQYLI